MGLKFAAVLALICLPGVALSAPEVLPELYAVTGVAPGDRLNIRATASAQAPVIGSLAPETRDLEVIAHQGSWAEVNAGEATGFVARRYLQPQASAWQSGALPAGLHCLGTEPFWDLRMDGGTAKLRSPDAPEQSFAITSISDRGYPEDRMRAVQAGDLSFVIAPEACSDGMSERSFGLLAVLQLRSGPRPMLAGCCSIAP